MQIFDFAVRMGILIDLQKNQQNEIFLLPWK